MVQKLRRRNTKQGQAAPRSNSARNVEGETTRTDQGEGSVERSMRPLQMPQNEEGHQTPNADSRFRALVMEELIWAQDMDGQGQEMQLDAEVEESSLP